MSTVSETPTKVEKKASSSLWAKHSKVYPRRVDGTFRKLRWAAMWILLGIYYIGPWLRWDRGPNAPDQAILLDLPARRFYLFFIELWPQQIYYLTGALILAAVGLFLATALSGRLWCGYACPQTVWTDLFVWVERFVEGDRNERIRLDKGPWTFAKIRKKAVKNALWLLISLLTGGAFILYFVDAPTFMRDLVTFQADSTTLWFIVLFTATTYLLAGFGREQVCIYMCPWPRFQASMTDEESLIVTYSEWRGEGRSHVHKGQSWEERQAAGMGDCIDCYACVQVCPTGIDIRDGNQLACIGCGMCVDACNEIMRKIGRPEGLVRFDTQNNQVAMATTGQPAKYKLVRPRTIIYTLMLVAVLGVMAGGLMSKASLDVSVIRDRAPLYVALTGNQIRNAYTFKISNMTRDPRDYVLTAAGIEGATLAVAGEHQDEEATQLRLTAAPDSVATYRILVTAPQDRLKGSSTPLSLTLKSATGDTDTYETVFLGPEK